jgi:Protein of unknown function (DUF4232)
MRRILGRGAALMAIAGLIAACGLQKDSNAPGQHGGDAARSMACTRADIRLRVAARSTTKAAGATRIPLDFTNTSKSSCELAGYPVIGVADGRIGPRIGSAATLDRTHLPSPLQLQAGRTAHLWVLLFDIGSVPASVCSPVTAAGLRVKLPGQHRTQFVYHRLKTCSKRIRGAHFLTVEPFHAGQAEPGSTQ